MRTLKVKAEKFFKSLFHTIYPHIHMNKGQINHLIDIAKYINGAEREPQTKRMVVGFLIANTSMQLKEINNVFSFPSIGYMYEVIFSEHKSKRDNDEDYRKRYYSLCANMNVKNRL